MNRHSALYQSTNPFLAQSAVYRYGFNGKDILDEFALTSSSYDFENRILNAPLGRWLSIDPSMVYYESPFAVNRNNPLVYKDSNGKFPDPASVLLGFIIDAGTEYLLQVAGSLSKGKPLLDAMSDVDVGDILWEGAKGAASAVIFSPTGNLSKALKKISDPRIREVVGDLLEATQDALTEAYERYDEGGWDALKQFNFLATVGENFASKKLFNFTTPKIRTDKLDESIKVAERQIDRQIRVNGTNARPSRIDQLKKMEQQKGRLEQRQDMIRSAPAKVVENIATAKASVQQQSTTSSKGSDSSGNATSESSEKQSTNKSSSSGVSTSRPIRKVVYASF